MTQRINIIRKMSTVVGNSEASLLVPVMIIEERSIELAALAG
jgi:hypothetical protein